MSHRKPSRNAGIGSIAVILALGPAWSASADGCRLLKGSDTPNPADDVRVCREDVWIHMNRAANPGGLPVSVGNLASLGMGDYPTWDRHEPWTSIFGPEGGIAIVHGDDIFSPDPAGLLAMNDPYTSFIVEGTFRGNLDNLAATLFFSAPGGPSLYPPYLRVQLTVDGKLVFPADWVFTKVTRWCELSDYWCRDGGFYKMRFALTDMFDAMSTVNDPDGMHSVRLAVGSIGPHLDGVFYYDAREFPAGIVFNIEESQLDAYTRVSLK